MEIVVLATDFSDGSEAAYPFAASLVERAGKQNAQLILLHVIEDVFRATFGLHLGEDEHDVLDEAEARAQAELESLAQIEFQKLIPQTAVVRADKAVHEEIIRFAERRNADAIVIGNRGMGNIEHALIGSVAEKLVRGANCPVLVVPLGKSNK